MTETTKTKPPIWFWMASAIGLFWNLLGAWSYLQSSSMSEEYKANFTPDQLALVESTPSWVTAAFAIAVWGGVLGCIALLLRKKWAKPVLLLSLLGIAVQMSHSFFMTDANEVFGPAKGFVIPLIVIVIGILLYQFAGAAIRRGWLT